MTTIDILTILLRPYLIQAIFCVGVACILKMLSRRNLLCDEGGVRAKTFAKWSLFGIFMSGVFASFAVLNALDWRMRPADEVVEAWVFAPWHAFMVESVVELGLLFASIKIMMNPAAGGLRRFGFRMPSVSGRSVFISVVASFLFVYVIIIPSTYLLISCVKFMICHECVRDSGLGSHLWMQTWIYRNVVHGDDLLVSVLIFIWIMIVDPVLEEIFFRGVIQTSFSERLNPYVANLAQAIFFSLMHLDFSKSIFLFMFGLLLGELARRSRSLIPSVVLHAAVNFVSLSLAMAS